jgi:predicted lipoprotein with Yx(FWY)xxD motif
MSALTRVTSVLFVLGAVALFAAGCGGGSGGSANGENAAASTGGKTVSGASVGAFGTVLVDSEGVTVYEFAKDNGTTSSCYGACAQSWPPVLASGKPSAGGGAMASQLGTTQRKDGSVQVTYAGHPLYTFVGDTEPGEATGNESTAFGGKWSVMNEAGEAVAGAPAESSSSESSGGYGY